MMNGSFKLALAALFLAAAAPALGLDHHWNVSSGNWGAASNWNPQTVPGVDDIVYVDFFNGAGGVATVNQTQVSPISITVMNSNIVGIAGNAINSGSIGVGGDFIIGSQGTHGTLSVTNSMPGINPYNGRVTVGNTMRIGLFSGVGTVNQNDGTVTVNQLLRVADSNSGEFVASGVYNLSGIGVLNAARLDIGYGGDTNPYTNMQATFNLSGGGVLNVATAAQAHDLMIGGGGSSGVFNQTGGTLYSPSRLIDMARGGGTAVYNYSGGSFSVPGIAFSNNSGTLNYLNGATLSVGQLQMTGGGHVLLTAGKNKQLNMTLLWMANNAAEIDLSDNTMTTSSVLETLGGQPIRTLLSRGYNGGAWNGTGIRSSAAAATSASAHKTALGYDHPGSPSGPLTTIRYTYSGDANLDRKVDLTDFTFLASNFNGTNKYWFDGDFNYDGNVNLTDFTLLASNFNQTLTAGRDFSLRSNSTAVVPEPTFAALIMGASIFSCPGRPRRS